MNKRKRIKVATFLAALKKNGFPWTRNMMYNINSGASCAIGQAARNLGVTPGTDEFSHFAWALEDTLRNKYETNIVKVNDHAKEYSEVVEYAEKYLGPHRNEMITINYHD